GRRDARRRGERVPESKSALPPSTSVRVGTGEMERRAALLPGLRLRSVHGSTENQNMAKRPPAIHPGLRLRSVLGSTENQNMAKRPPAILPGLRTASFVHGSGEIETRRNVGRHFFRDYACAPSTAPRKIETSGTPSGDSSGTALALRPRLRENRNIGNVFRHFFRDCAYAPSTAPGKSKHGGTSGGDSSGTADCVLRPRLRGNQNTAKRPSALLPGLRTASFVHGSGEIKTSGTSVGDFSGSFAGILLDENAAFGSALNGNL
ncbi:MAG: hypothetical protein Q4C96_09005, partial [Planctomycetia bacterium]|nr:hypothetical protein [Planctomycetia bacterium]